MSRCIHDNFLIVLDSRSYDALSCNPTSERDAKWNGLRTCNSPPLESSASGWINGLIGVVIFSGSLPATRVAVLEFDPVFLTVARATIAGVLALCLLLLFKEKRPARQSIAAVGHRGPGRGGRLSAADGAGAAIRDVRAFHRLRRPAAAGDRGVRRVARWRAAAAGVLVFLGAGQPAGGRVCRRPKA